MDKVDAALRALLAAGSGAEAERAVSTLLRLGFQWRPVGGKEGNFGLVNIGADPGVALVERVTNAIDAVIDESAARVAPAIVAEWESPRDAVSALFDITEGRLGSVGAAALATMADRVVLAIADGKRPERPTLEIRDYGAGMSPSSMPATILDLAGSNKLTKLHLAGAYGQGGSTTFAFTGGGTLIASAADGRLGVTFVRYRELDPRRNKNGRYDFLAGSEGRIATLDAGSVSFATGTLVRHFDYELPRHYGDVDGPAGLVSLLRASLFDPVLPLRVVDRRGLFGATNPAGIIFAGARADLDTSPLVEHRQSLALPFGRRAQHGVVSVHYWILRADDERGTVRPDVSHPVLVTNFGQTHDAWDYRFIVDALKLPFLKTALIVQVELDMLKPAAKRQLLSSTRDRLKRGTLHRDLVQAVTDALLDETALHDANVERRRRLLREQQVSDQRRLQRRFAELMEKFHPGIEPAARADAKAHESGVALTSTEGSGSGETADLPTLAHPTFVRFATAAISIDIPLGRTCTLRIESDAPDGYCTRYAQARLVLAPDPSFAVETLRVSDFRGGRARFAVHATAAHGISGTLTARLTTAEGSVLAATIAFTIVPEPEREQPADSNGRRNVRLPRIFDIFKDRWKEFDFDETSVADVSESRDDYSIFVNMDNRHIARLLSSVAYQEQGLARMRGTYLLQTAFYSFLLHEQRNAFEALDAAQLEAYQRLELDRVARTVVTAIASVERIDSAALSADY